jgi:hypothetical protein
MKDANISHKISRSFKSSENHGAASSTPDFNAEPRRRSFDIQALRLGTARRALIRRASRAARQACLAGASARELSEHTLHSKIPTPPLLSYEVGAGRLPRTSAP